MGYRWKPSASQRREYAEKMREKETMKFIHTTHPIREGCVVEYYSVNRGEVIAGTIINSSYGAEKNQHTFTIQSGPDKILVKGRNLYQNLLLHCPGEVSIKEKR